MSIKSKFCVRCGKETSKLIDGICSECYFKTKGIKVPKKIKIQVCPRCEAIKWRGVWTKSEYPLEYFLTRDLIDKIRVPENAELEEVKIKKLDKNGIIEVTISVLGKKFSQEKQVRFEILKNLCKNCARYLAKTPKTIIQLRTHKAVEKFIEDILDYIENYRTNIIKVEHQKNGLDIYLSNKEAGKHLAYDLRKRFRCKMSESVKQYGWDKSKNRPLTRTTYLLKQR